MSEHSVSRDPQIRIVHHADGSATVDGVAVVVEPGQDVRDAAYLAAVAVAVERTRGAAGPVAATRAEADGTMYPLTLYPSRTVLPAAPPTRRGGRTRLPSRLRPVPTLIWLTAGACGCVLLAVLGTMLLRQNDPGLVRLSVHARDEAVGAPVARAIGSGVAGSAWNGVLATATAPASSGRGPGRAVPTASPRAGARQPGAIGSAHAGGPAGGVGAPGPGASQAPKALPLPAPGPNPKPRAAASPAAVTDLTLALVGGNKADPDIAFVITVSTNGPGPVTLAYGYAGRSGAITAKSVPLAGQTEYAVTGTVPGRPYCGGSLTMRAVTSPAANDGAVTATTASVC